MPPRKSSIHDLPENVQLILNKKLGEGKTTLDEFVALLKQQGFEISRSAMGRYARSFRKEVERMRRYQQLSDMMVGELGDVGGTKLGRAAAHACTITAMKFVEAEPEDGGEAQAITPQELMFVTRSIRDAVAASKMERELEEAIRKAAFKEAADKLSAAEKSAGGKGLSAEAVAQLRRDFLGVKPPEAKPPLA
jgi:hypothetical protein